MPPPVRVAVIGGGWAGCAAAVEATRLGHQVALFEGSRTLGGRARRVELTYDGQMLALDNGQHILIGAYSESLKLMREVGVDVETALLRLPLTMQFPDGNGMVFPQWPAPFDAVAGILSASGWSWADRLSLLRAAIGWQLKGFRCAHDKTVASLCHGLTPGAMERLIEPLCVAALNTPAERASGKVFLRVMQDALFSSSGGSNLLLPRTDLSALLPDAAAAWLQNHGGSVHTGTRVLSIQCDSKSKRWTLGTDLTSGVSNADINADINAGFDAVVLACPPFESARLALTSALPCQPWVTLVRQLQHEPITTVYVGAATARLSQPMLALRSDVGYPAQFVFDRGQLGGPDGLLAFVISASNGDGAALSEMVRSQAAEQLGILQLEVLQTIIEKRATFACTPGLNRPPMQPSPEIAPSLLVCGDYIDGPYPATLEGAVRSGLDAARTLASNF